MAEGQFGLQIYFGHGALKFGKVEERVVSETVGATRRIQNDAFDGTIACVRHTAISGSYEDAMVSGPALLGRHVSEPL
jgi:hypothetical protein